MNKKNIIIFSIIFLFLILGTFYFIKEKVKIEKEDFFLYLYEDSISLENLESEQEVITELGKKKKTNFRI